MRIPNRYYNSPWIAQAAQNLSTAIYGDPRDELVAAQTEGAKLRNENERRKARMWDQTGLSEQGLAAALLGFDPSLLGSEDPTLDAYRSRLDARVDSSVDEMNRTLEPRLAFLDQSGDIKNEDYLARLRGETPILGDRRRQFGEIDTDVSVDRIAREAEPRALSAALIDAMKYEAGRENFGMMTPLVADRSYATGRATGDANRDNFVEDVRRGVPQSKSDLQAYDSLNQAQALLSGQPATTLADVLDFAGKAPQQLEDYRQRREIYAENYPSRGGGFDGVDTARFAGMLRQLASYGDRTLLGEEITPEQIAQATVRFNQLAQAVGALEAEQMVLEEFFGPDVAAAAAEMSGGSTGPVPYKIEGRRPADGG